MSILDLPMNEPPSPDVAMARNRIEQWRRQQDDPSPATMLELLDDLLRIVERLDGHMNKLKHITVRY